MIHDYLEFYLSHGLANWGSKDLECQTDSHVFFLFSLCIFPSAIMVNAYN